MAWKQKLEYKLLFFQNRSTFTIYSHKDHSRSSKNFFAHFSGRISRLMFCIAIQPSENRSVRTEIFRLSILWCTAALQNERQGAIYGVRYPVVCIRFRLEYRWLSNGLNNPGSPSRNSALFRSRRAPLNSFQHKS